MAIFDNMGKRKKNKKRKAFFDMALYESRPKDYLHRLLCWAAKYDASGSNILKELGDNPPKDDILTALMCLGVI